MEINLTLSQIWRNSRGGEICPRNFSEFDFCFPEKFIGKRIFYQLDTDI